MKVSNQATIREFPKKLTAYNSKGEFFASLATYLAKTLNVTHILIGYLTDDGHHMQTVALYEKGNMGENFQYPLQSSICENAVGKTFCSYTHNVQNLFPEDAKLALWDIESYAGLPLHDSAGKSIGFIAALHTQPIDNFDFTESILNLIALRVESELESYLKDKRKLEVDEKLDRRTVLDLLLETSKTIVSEVELKKVVQKITDVATKLSGAEFGAFFYNMENEEGEKYLLYTISGVPKEKFSKFPMPRNTKIFTPTFAGNGIIRYDDVTQEKYFGKNAPYHGMPEGHLPVKSYLAVPVISPSSKEVIGGLFFGHPQPAVFTEDVEKLVEGIAAQGAIAMENARLFEEQKKTEKAFEEARKKLELALNASAVATWSWDIQKDIITADPNFAEFFGADPEVTAKGISSKFFATSIYPDDKFRMKEIVEEAIASGNPFEAEFRLMESGDGYQWVLARGQTEYDDKHRPLYFSGSLLNIHERKLAEEALAEQKLQYESIFNSTSDAILIFDDAGILVEVNPAALTMHGYTSDELLGKHIKIIIHHNSHHSFSEFVAAVKAGKQYYIAGKHLKKDGSLIDVEVIGSSFLYKGTPHMLAAVRDVTKHKKNELALQNKEETLRLTVEATGLGTWDFNPRTGVLCWSDHCKALFGLPYEAFIDYNVFLQRLHPDDRERVDNIVKWALNPESGGKYDIEYRTIEKGKWLRASGEAIFNEEGKAIRFLGTVLDITEQKQRQHELVEKTRELEFANEDLKNFTYTISHDIKNPLSSLMFASSVSEDFTTVEEFREIMPMVVKSSKKINGILNGLVEIIKEEETKGKLENIDIAEAIEDVKSELNEVIEENECQIHVSIHKKEVLFIRSYFQSILRNLIDNAIKYRSPERSPEIYITVGGDKQYLDFTITDNGTGIDIEKHKKNLFQPFKRFSEDKPGTGIGLFMIKRIVEKYQGEISIKSQPGIGTTIHFTIPTIIGSDHLRPESHPDSIQPPAAK